MNFTVDSALERSKEVIFSEVEGELVMMSLENGKYYGIDAIGGSIWKMLETPLKVSEIYDRLMKEYQVDAPTCKQDVNLFLEQLIEQNLVSVK